MGRSRRSERKRAQAQPRRPRPLSRVAPGLVAVLVIAAVFVLHAHAFRFTQDDAYISLRYAANLVEGHGLVFNPGERVEGYSNFAWTMLLALIIRLGIPPVPAATWLGIAFAAGAILVAARFARAIEGRWGTAAVGTAALLAGTSAFALWCTGGLETAMFAFLVTAGLERGLAPDVSARGRFAAPLLLAAAALTRPDGALIAALWIVVRAASGDRRTLLRDVAILAAPMIPYAAWKFWYYGDLLPNTYYAKAGTSAEYFARGVDYAREYFGAYGAWGLAPALALASLRRGGLRSLEARLLVVWLGYAAYIVVIGGDVLHVHRFWLGVLPIGAILVARGAAWRPAVAAAVLAAVVAVGLVRNWSGIRERRATEVGFVENMSQTGTWLGANFPRGSRVAITTIGAVGYFSRLHVIDMLGLTDREIARSPQFIEGVEDTWREIKYNAASVLRRRPDIILFSTGVRPSAAAEKALYLHADFYDSYFAYFFRSTANRVQTQIGFRLRPDAPTFREERLPAESVPFLAEYIEGHLAQSRKSDFAVAAKHFERAWELSGGRCPWAREWLGSSLFDAGRIAADSSTMNRGLEILREVAERDAYSTVALLRLGDDALRKDPVAAERLFTRMLELDPHDAPAWMGRAEAARLLGDLEAAYRYAAEGIRRWGTNPPYLMQMGTIAAAMGDFDVADRCYRHALLIDPNFEGARRGLEILGALERGELPELPRGGG
ncbi:MAG: tetratricopeptide repeat protein [Candidatus Eiseniibacteriota bacterium]